ncbi:MAG: alpha/beta hydrolase [Firmicutes bacterium]|nr:alpha/beta hydrolase [Bacillota bacterium]
MIVADLLEQKGISTYSLLGHSMGGEVALNIAYLYPSRVEKLILVDAAGLQADRQAAFPTSFYDAIFKNYYVQKAFLGSAYYDKRVVTQKMFDEMYYFNEQGL